MHITVVFPMPYLRAVMRRLTESPNSNVCCPVGIAKCDCDDELQLLMREAGTSTTTRTGGNQRCAVVSTTERPLNERELAQPLGDESVVAHIALGSRDVQGRVWGIAKVVTDGNAHSTKMASIQRITVPGAGMHVIAVSAPMRLDGIADLNGQDEQLEMSPDAFERWSRTIGALGVRVWQRLISLRTALIGCGRIGSVIATMLVRMGVRDITLIDPDIVEEHNIGEMNSVDDYALGQFKVEALAEFLQSHCASKCIAHRIHSIAKPIAEAYRDALRCDVIICCADNDAGRLACGIIATLFHKVLLDVGAGVLHASENEIDIQSQNSASLMGADVRLILPGDGCLLCFGNLADYAGALRQFLRADQMRNFDRQQWWEERKGSLRTLNMLASSIAVQMLCDLLAGEVQSSTWAHIYRNSQGVLQMEWFHRDATQQHPHCPLCIRAGLGEEGVEWSENDGHTFEAMLNPRQ